MRYHINDGFEVMPCTAEEGNCPFGDNPHFNDKKSADQGLEKLLTERLGTTSTVTKRRSFKEFYESTVPYPLKQRGLEQQKLLETARAEGRSLDFEEMKVHETYVEDMTSFLREHKGETYIFYGEDEGYTEERELEQEKVVTKMIESMKNIPRERKALLGGGMGGAGKTSALYRFEIVDPDDYASVNPDDFKEAMAEAGMIPHVPGLLPMEASTLVHEEASDLTYAFFAQMREQGTNVFLDQTLASIKNTVKDLDMCIKQGYSIDSFFVDISPEISSERATYRYRNKTNEYLIKGTGNGGRPIPKFFSDTQTSTSKTYQSRNAENFVKLVRI